MLPLEPVLLEPVPPVEPVDPVEPVLPVEPVAATGAFSSEVSWACAWDRVPCAAVTAACRSVGSIVAITSPAETWSPSLTSTLVTVPEAENEADAVLTLATDPVRFTVWATEPIAAVAVT